LPDDWFDDPSQGDETPVWLSLPHRYKVPARSDVHGRRGFYYVLYFFCAPFIFLFSPIAGLLRRAAAKLGRTLLRTRPARRPAVLGYTPIELFVALCAVTFGTYPYFWLWSNANAFTRLCGGRLQGKRLKQFAATGFCVQLLLPAALALYALWRFAGTERALESAMRCALAYAVSYAVLIFPQRCYCYFHLRWNLRNAVTQWDRDEMMIDRTMTSWLKLFIFGSAYIQSHTNRLMGLGMPGFADQDEIRPEFSFRKWLREYVVIRKPAIEAVEVEIVKDIGESDDG
jgi:hypothetical protein